MQSKPKKDKAFDPLADLRRARPLDEEADRLSSHVTTRRQEEEIAALVGGRRHIGSGSLPTLKSDASSERYQIEAKQTKHASISLSLEWLGKITYEAMGNGRTPLMHLRFLNVPRSMAGTDSDWVVMPQSEFKRLLTGGLW